MLIYKVFVPRWVFAHACLVLFLLQGDVLAQGMDEPILPIPAPEFTAQQKAQLALGRSLFNDPRLSGDNTISCASCHSLELGGVDGQRVSVGIKGAMGTVNAPTVINSVFNLAQFWDGRAASLEEQAAGPVHNPVEMGSNWAEVLEKLRRDELYPAQFNTLFADGLTVENIQYVIALFESSLVTVNAPFDRYLRGDEQAITEQARRGYRLFKSYGCVACHQGRNVGGNMYARMGAVGDFFLTKKEPIAADLGRYNVTGDELDRHVFKVPSLRLVTLTAPYFHDGSARSLAEAIDTMARFQLGRRISSEDTALMVQFLESLAGPLYQVVP